MGENHLELSSPKSCHRDHWHKFLSEHQDWIQKHYQPLFTSQWVRLWGQKYSWELRSHHTSGYEKMENHITFLIRYRRSDDGELDPQNLSSPIIPQEEFLRQQIRLCYLRELQQWLPSRVLFWLHTLNVSATRIRIRFMRSLWGSCAVQRRVLTFNGYLAAYDKHFVDSVILHECAHLIIPHHGPKFRALLKEHESQLFPRQEVCMPQLGDIRG